MIASAAVVLLKPGSPTTPTWSISAPPPRYGLRLEGTGRHRHPIAGESEQVRWTVTNIGNRPLNDVRLNTAVPPGWTLTAAPGCQSSRTGLRCDLGPLAADRSRTIRIEMVAQRPLLSFKLTARTRFRAAGQDFTGPSAAFEVTVVTRR